MSVHDSLSKDKKTSISLAIEFWTKKKKICQEKYKSSNSSHSVTKEQAASLAPSDFVQWPCLLTPSTPKFPSMY